VNIFFRTDASVQIGTGHVMRCLTLADRLREAGANWHFHMSCTQRAFTRLIHLRGHNIMTLTANKSQSTLNNFQDKSINHAFWLGTDWTNDAADTQHAIAQVSVDWLIVDHYALDDRWESAMRPHCKKMMVIDDLADRAHDCDLLLDQNLGRSTKDYNPHISSNTIVMIGPRYALLRPEFANLRDSSLRKRRHPKLQHLLITLGGVDQNNFTEYILKALINCTLPTELNITVVMGTHSPWISQVEATAKMMPCPTKIMVNVNNMAQVMVSSDLAISATGGTIFELCTLGLPTLSIAVAKNQVGNGFALNAARATHQINCCSIQQDLVDSFVWIKTESNLAEMQRRAAQICDGLGAIRVASVITK
jgi:UDP-2,4-diacetamido-2,4,6-trideoxy-beta-L-altropyranose hydrolase